LKFKYTNKLIKLEELDLIFQNLNLEDQMEQQLNPAPQLKIINDLPLLSGTTKDLDGFLIRIELSIEANPQRFPDDRRKVMFVISYFTGRALNWASCLRRNNNEVHKNYENFINELRRNFGDPDVDAAAANGLT